MPRLAYTDANGEAVFVELGVPLPIVQSAGLTAFGDQSIAENTPQAQIKFNYSINADLMTSKVNNALGSVSVVNNELVVSTGAAANSYAALFSKKCVIYSAGQGVKNLFSARFTTGVSGNTQFVGIGQASDGLFVGFNGATFGILRRVAGAPHTEQFEITTGAVTATGNITITLDGDAQTVAVASGDSTADVARKIKATDFSQVGDGWTIFIAGSFIEFTSFIAGPRVGAFTFTDTDTTGVVATNTTILTGVAANETDFVAQTAWNIDTMDGSGDDNNPSGQLLDPTKGNVYEIQFQWLGFGALTFSLENSSTGRLVPVHTIQYANLNITPSLRNPTLPLCTEVINTSNATDIITRSSSAGGFTEGKISMQGIPHASENTKALTTTETSILVLHNNPVYQGVENRTVIKILSVSVGSDGNKLATFRGHINPILGGLPVFTDFNSDTSVVAIDTAGTTVTGGNKIFSRQLGKTDAQEIDLIETDITLQPGDSFVVTGTFFTAGSGDLSASVNWEEEQ